MHLPLQAVKNCDNQVVPMGGLVPAPFVTAGEPIEALPANGFMFAMWAVAASEGEMFD